MSGRSRHTWRVTAVSLAYARIAILRGLFPTGRAAPSDLQGRLSMRRHYCYCVERRLLLTKQACTPAPRGWMRKRPNRNSWIKHTPADHAKVRLHPRQARHTANPSEQCHRKISTTKRSNQTTQTSNYAVQLKTLFPMAVRSSMAHKSTAPCNKHNTNCARELRCLLGGQRPIGASR